MIQRDYTVKEAASVLGVGRAAVYMAIQRGQLISWKRGVRFIDADELKRWDKVRRKRRT